LHAWSIALTLAGKARDKDFLVKRLAYAEMEHWSQAIPAGASQPFLETATGEVLSGGLPILQFIEETEPRAGFLPEGPAERVRIRNRALLAVDLLNALRPVFVSKTPQQQESALTSLFEMLNAAEAQPWSAMLRMDRVVLAAAATVAASQAKLMHDARWDRVPRMKALVLDLSTHEAVRATRAENYGEEFREFFQGVWKHLQSGVVLQRRRTRKAVGQTAFAGLPPLSVSASALPSRA